ncbi:MAG TPA: nuclear transport factor 2 family protein [Burkholderiales bacterium]|nr:nuclear transport factor 2 family protein [Burkholderiales bacterium]
MTNDPAQTVRDYLAAMERRDLAAAKAMLAPGFFMLFPGGKRFETLEALVDWAKPRYRRALKTYDRFDVAAQPDGSAVVYCFGALHGELNDGSPYFSIRFIDRFTVRDGKLVDQMVWNDLAETLGKLG